jgi:hypothetical protein
MAILDVVGQELEDGGVGTLAVDLFLGRMPGSPDVCWAVYEYEGLPPDDPFQGYGLDRPRLQVVARATREDYPTARDNLILARDVLVAIDELQVGGNVLHRVQPLGSVMPLDYDMNDRPRMVMNFQAWWS